MTTTNNPPAQGPVPRGLLISRPAGRAWPQQAVVAPRRFGLSGYIQIAPVVILTLALLMPPEVRINFAGQNFYSYRLAWLMILPWVMFKILKGHFSWRIHDFLLLAGSGWIAVSLCVVYGFAKGLPAGLGLALDLIVPYFIARISVSNFQDFRRTLIVLAPVFFFFAILLPIEAFLNFRFIRETAISIFGSLGGSYYGMTSTFRIATDMRYGLLRATGPFSHPILAGIFFASLLPLYYWSGIRGWPRLLGLGAGLFAVFTLSSAAYLAILLFLVLATYDFIRRLVTFLSWPLFVIVTSCVALVLHVVSQNGLVSVLIRFTLDPQTGRYRLLIWDYGTESVARNPFFGIGFERFVALAWMGDSIDAHWLNLAVRHGLLSTVFLLSLILLTIWGCAKTVMRVPEPNSSLMIGLAVALVIFLVVGFSVAYFGGLLIWFVLVLGIACSTSSLSSKAGDFRSSLTRISQP